MKISSQIGASAWFCSLVLGCASASSTPLDSPKGPSTIGSGSPSTTAPLPSSSSPGAEEGSGLPADEPRIGAHKPSDDTRVNSGAGSPTKEGARSLAQPRWQFGL